jgi:glutamyl-tRNA reductase
MPLHVVGLNHQSASLEVREKLAFPPERQGDALADLAAQPGVTEAVLVSTCNRT